MCAFEEKTSDNPAGTLARALERGLVLLPGTISATALSNTIIANWDKLAKLVHEVHAAK